MKYYSEESLKKFINGFVRELKFLPYIELPDSYQETEKTESEDKK